MILQREVTMAARRGFGPGDFAHHPNVAELTIEQIPDRHREFADGKSPPVGFPVQADLLHNLFLLALAGADSIF